MPPGDEHIEHIMNALWSQGGRPGASVMVGAGFSLNAVKLRSDAPAFLMWPQLASRFEAGLRYPANSGRGTSDALRLASEYETAFGTTALEDLLREAVPDQSHDPGELHTLLVSLPWADIFTTNYDQLLERASRTLPERQYSVIRTIRDIPASARPRIVKLHGSFPSDRPFIITEEHYRTYPRDFAPFVNLVRQAVMETVFCLIGFSGDDPNFLQWAGWVRDSLGPAAPPIYLCGVLDLTPPRQHLLRSRQIIPVDLGLRFPRSEYPDTALRHRRAIEWFLRSLLQGEPFDDSRWPTPSPPPVHDDASGLPALLGSPPPHLQIAGARRHANPGVLDVPAVCDLVSRWHTERSWYPGWICLPDANRLVLWEDTRAWLFDPERSQWIAVLEAMPVAEAILAWYELAWRLERSLCPLVTLLSAAIARALERLNPFPTEVTDMQGALTPATDLAASAHWLRPGMPGLTWSNVASCWIDLAFAIARCAREDFDSALHARWLNRLATLQHQQPETRDRYFCEKSMQHLFRLEQDALAQALSSWRPDPTRALFQAKHAALLAEHGDAARARSELQSALVAMQVASHASRNKRLLSEEGWVLWLVDALDDYRQSDRHDRRSYMRRQRRDQLALYGCDPDDMFTLLSRRLRDLRLRQMEISRGAESFDPGYRRQQGWSFHREDPQEWFLVRMLEQGAAFVRAPGIRNYPAAVASAATGLFFAGQRHLALSLLLRLGKDDAIEVLLDRATIARLEPEFAAEVYDWLSFALREAIGSATPERMRAKDLSARLLTPLIATISLILFRLPVSRLDDVKDLLVELYETDSIRGDYELPKSLRLLFRRAFYSMVPSEVCDWLPDLLALPVVESDGYRFEGLPEVLTEWQIPPDYRIARGGGTEPWSDIVQTLLRKSHLRGETRHRSLYRLSVLFRIGGLNDKETTELADAAWGILDDDGLPADTDLVDDQWLIFPAPAGVDPAGRLRHAMLRKAFPAVLVDHDGQPGLSSGAVHAFELHMEVITRGSDDIFPRPRRGATISWTGAEAAALFAKLEAWTAANVSDRHREFEEFDDARTAATSLLLHVLAPALAKDHAVIERMLAVARRLDRSTGEMTAVYLLQHVAGQLDADRLGELLLDAVYQRNAQRAARVDEAGATFLKWLAYAGRELCAPPTESMVGRIVDSLVGGGPQTLAAGLRIVSRVLEWFSSLIDDRSVRSIERALRYLADATALSPNASSDPAARSEESAKPQLRAAAARAAFHLSRLYETTSRRASDVVERWRRIAETDPLPEVRRAWFESDWR